MAPARSARGAEERGEDGESTGSSGVAGGALQLQLRLLDSGGAPAPNSGEGEVNVDGEMA